MYNNYHSENVDIANGVPQGSIIGPLLYSICINDLILASNKLNFLMYADDTTIYFNLEDFDQNHMQTEINSELNKVNLWLKLNQLSLNTNKTKLMVFHRKQKQIKKQIERVHSFNFLGILLDETLSWKNHAIMIANKISRVTGILYRLKNLFPKEILLTLQFTHRIVYKLWVINLGERITQDIDTLQKKAIRQVTNST